MILISALLMQSDTPHSPYKLFEMSFFKLAQSLPPPATPLQIMIYGFLRHKLFSCFLCLLVDAQDQPARIKLIRIIIIFRYIFRTIEQTYRPNKTIILRLGQKSLSDTFIHNVLIYVILIFTIQGISVIVLSLLEPNLNLISLFSAVQSALCYIGPGFDFIGPTENFSLLKDSSKVFLSFLMILGRLEIYALIVLFIPKIWRSYS